MRLWSLHPGLLDRIGLIALWRESLLAKHVLEERTKGYRNHPQLDRFKSAPRPVDSIHFYLEKVFEEARQREFNFDAQKFNKSRDQLELTVNDEQLKYEFDHLLNKLRMRDPKLYVRLKGIKKIEPHPLFIVVKGPVEPWEIIRPQ